MTPLQPFVQRRQLLRAFRQQFFAEPFARFATLFTVTEYFWFYVIGLGCAVLVALVSAAVPAALAARLKVATALAER